MLCKFFADFSKDNFQTVKFSIHIHNLETITTFEKIKTKPIMSKKSAQTTPVGYYDEINDTIEKVDEIKDLFHNFEIIEHTFEEDEFYYLSDLGLALEIVNPLGSSNIIMVFDGEFILFFDGWHTHYPTYLYDYNVMKDTALAIIENKLGAVVLSEKGRWCGSTLIKGNHQRIYEEIIHETKFREFKKKKVDVSVIYWKPEYSYEISNKNL